MLTIDREPAIRSLEHRPQAGASLIEMIAFVVIISVSLTGIISVFNEANQRNVDPIPRVRALECAQAKMDEILARKYADNSPTGGIPACGSAEVGAVACSAIGTNTGLLNDVGDYAGQVDNSLDNCSLNVAVTQPGLSGAPARLITVTATSSGGEQVTLSAYKVNF